MFAGIVEIQSRMLEFKSDVQNHLLKVEKPNIFDDLKNGDSISVNGVCLTIEAFNDEYIQFALGFETLKVTGWNLQKLSAQPLNLERSLKMSDRIHGHMVAGHVDGLAQVIDVQDHSHSRILRLRIHEQALLPLIWKKGSVALNGVSLTINDVRDNEFEVCLIPETLKRTNLSQLKVGEFTTIEADQWARAMSRAFDMERTNREQHHRNH